MSTNFRRYTIFSRDGNRVHCMADAVQSVELGEKVDCTKNVSDLNKEISYYSSLVIGLGMTHDSEILREELKESRKRAFELSRQNMRKLIPLLRKKICENADCKDLEKLFRQYYTLLEILVTQLIRTLMLQKDFPLHTGLSESLLGQRLRVVLEQQSSLLKADEAEQEREELKTLELEITDLQQMLNKIHQAVGIMPWAIEPYNAIKCDIYGSLDSIADSFMAEECSDGTDFQQRWKRCICIMSVALSAVILSATVLGLCLALQN